MSIRKKMAVPVALAIGVLGIMVVAQIASASHPRPKSATPTRVSLVPAYKQCTAANSTHGAPLTFPSCNPPVQASSFLTVGTPDANGAVANAVGSIRLDVLVQSAPASNDVSIVAAMSDVRCKPAESACGAANAADGPDYTGQVQGTAQIRITDHYNGASGTDPGTVTDIPFPVNTSCTATAGNTGQGSDCNIATTANAVVVGSVKTGKRANVEIQQLQVFDGGAVGIAGASDATLFQVQGIFIP